MRCAPVIFLKLHKQAMKGDVMGRVVDDLSDRNADIEEHGEKNF